MEVLFFCPRWGSEDIPWERFCEKVLQAGYHGIESPVPQETDERKYMHDILKETGLKFIGQYYQSFEKDFSLHKTRYREHLELFADMDCILVDSQTGKDYFSTDQNIELFEIAKAFTKNTGIPIAHETHRNKALFAAHRFRELNAYYSTYHEGIDICADFSHWCCVSESFLEQQQEAVNMAIATAVHLHARVGSTQSPQVPDFRLPEYKEAFDTHLAWWDAIIAHRRDQGRKSFTITPEFGPMPYMQALPYTGMPVANQWELNKSMMRFLEERYRE